jgi:hypothetical protein
VRGRDRGATTVFNLGGTPEQLEWRRRVVDGDLLEPTIYTSPPFFNEPRVDSPDEVEHEIAATVAAGYDLLKYREIVGPNPTTVGLSLDAYQRMNEAARRARLPLVGHAPVNLGLDAMVNARQQALAHVGRSGEFGTIAVGKRADLLLVERDPLQDLSSLQRPVGVMVRGRWLNREQLDSLLTALRS